MDIRDNQLFLGGCGAEDLAKEFGTPLYIYEESVIRRQCALFRDSFGSAEVDIHYALKANANPALLAILLEEGIGIDAVSPMEVRLCLEVGFAPERILFTGNNTSEEETLYCLEEGVQVNVGSLAELDRYGRLNPGGRVSIRLNPDVGAGHHPHVITGGPRSKFGIYHTEKKAIADLLARHNLTLVGIHSHIGTGILEPEDMLLAMEIVLKTATDFEGLEFIDFGGGFGVPYHPDQQALPMKKLGNAMGERFADFCRQVGRKLRMKLEPGRFIMAEAGTLLTRITNLHHTPEFAFVGTDSGFNHLIRPAMYGAYHEMVNASAVEGDPHRVVVAGNICESGDVFTQGKDGIETRPISEPLTDQLLAIRNAGAYGMVLASNYNMRPRPPEVLVRDGNARLIRRRETYQDLMGTIEDWRK